MRAEPEHSSFRDRDGFIFYSEGAVFRAINRSYAADWEKLKTAPFFRALLSENKLIAFSEVNNDFELGGDVASVIKVDRIPFISYPSEWDAGKLKAAALLTLDLQQRALADGYTLKDASAFNVQFRGSSPVFIDTLSFAPYVEGEPWQAYRQFCRHFLAPLLMEKYGFGELRRQLSNAPEGISLDACSRLLPFRSKLGLTAGIHIHLHARFERSHGHTTKSPPGKLKTSLGRTRALVTQLQQAISSIAFSREKSEWLPYYESFSYNDESFRLKKDFVRKHLDGKNHGLCADLGANTGEFSQIASENCGYVVACDLDAEVVKAIGRKGMKNVLPLVVDLNNPTPSFGWNSRERSSFVDRLRSCDVVLALALVHHLCIGNNLPFSQLAAFFAGLNGDLIIEFVPKEDPQSQRLLVTRKDIFSDYTEENFRIAFSAYFSVVDELALPGSGRRMFMFRKKSHGKT